LENEDFALKKMLYFKREGERREFFQDQSWGVAQGDWFLIVLDGNSDIEFKEMQKNDSGTLERSNLALVSYMLKNNEGLQNQNPGLVSRVIPHLLRKASVRRR